MNVPLRDNTMQRRDDSKNDSSNERETNCDMMQEAKEERRDF